MPHAREVRDPGKGVVGQRDLIDQPGGIPAEGDAIGGARADRGQLVGEVAEEQRLAAACLTHRREQRVGVLRDLLVGRSLGVARLVDHLERQHRRILGVGQLRLTVPMVDELRQVPPLRGPGGAGVGGHREHVVDG